MSQLSVVPPSMQARGGGRKHSSSSGGDDDDENTYEAWVLSDEERRGRMLLPLPLPLPPLLVLVLLSVLLLLLPSSFARGRLAGWVCRRGVPYQVYRVGGGGRKRREG